MSFLSYLRDLLRGGAPDTSEALREATSKLPPPPPRMGLCYPDFTGGDPLAIATVYRCVNLLADSVANLRLVYMRKKGDIFVPDTNSRLHYLLTVQPCAYMSAFDFWRQVILYVHLKGNAYIIPRYSYTLDIDSLELVNPACVLHDTRANTYTVSGAGAVDATYDESEIIHIKNYSHNGKTGVSTLAFARTAVDISTTGDAETLRRFQSGGNVRGIVSNDTSVQGFGEYQDEELQKTAVDLDGRFRNGERIVSVPGQAQFTPISLSSADMQFLESRRFSVRDICRFFGVHPSFIFDDTSNNYKSAEMANLAFLSTTLNPILRKIENELLRKLVSPTLSCKRRFEFDRRDLYACDLEGKAKYQSQTIASGIYTVNEWRLAENKEPVPGGDQALVSANLKSINELTTAGQTPANQTENE